MITVPHLDFAAIHDLRTSGKTWAEVGSIVTHGGNAVRKWYDAQCIARGVARARPKPYNPPYVRKNPSVKPPVAPIADFWAVHRDREAKTLWDAIAIKHGLRRQRISIWYYAECKKRGVTPVVLEKNHHLMGRTAFRDGEIYTPREPVSGGTLYEFLNPRCCQWMLNDRWPWRACGLPVCLVGGVYCVAHHEEAYHKRRVAA